MGVFAAGASSIATTSFPRASSSLPALPPSSKVSVGFVRRRTRSFTCKSSVEQGGVSGKDEAPHPPSASPNPFSGGKISSRVKVKRPPERAEVEPEIAAPFSVPPTSQEELFSTSSLPRSTPEVSSPFSASSSFEKRVSNAVEVTPAVPASGSSTSSSGKISSRVKVRTGDGSASKAFKAPPTISSPFDSSPVPKDPTMNKRGITMIPEMDERVLESRKQILKELYSERKSDSRMNAAPADIFDEPKPLSPEEDNFKFDLIKGAEPYLLLISFSLITAIMLGTAFLAYKLGAFHYNEL